jgi:hypothetical protein
VTVEKFYDVRRFDHDELVWASGRPAVIVGFVEEPAICGAHRGDRQYQVRYEGTGEKWNAWPYCESQLSERK